jgi:hypothetical protein
MAGRSKLLLPIAALAAALALAAQARAWAPDAATLGRGQAWAEVLPGGDGAALIHAAVDIPVLHAVLGGLRHQRECREGAHDPVGGLHQFASTMSIGVRRADKPGRRLQLRND